MFSVPFPKGNYPLGYDNALSRIRYYTMDMSDNVMYNTLSRDGLQSGVLVEPERVIVFTDSYYIEVIGGEIL